MKHNLRWTGSAPAAIGLGKPGRQVRFSASGRDKHVTSMCFL